MTTTAPSICRPTGRYAWASVPTRRCGRSCSFRPRNSVGSAPGRDGTGLRCRTADSRQRRHRRRDTDRERNTASAASARGAAVVRCRIQPYVEYHLHSGRQCPGSCRFNGWRVDGRGSAQLPWRALGIPLCYFLTSLFYPIFQCVAFFFGVESRRLHAPHVRRRETVGTNSQPSDSALCHCTDARQPSRHQTAFVLDWGVPGGGAVAIQQRAQARSRSPACDDTAVLPGCGRSGYRTSPGLR